MTEKKLALLKWCGGIDDETYTAGIPIQWIRHFDYEVYCSNDSASTEVYAVEWRDSKKPPKGGWKLYDAYVVHVSEHLNVLDAKMKMLEGLVSPFKKIPRRTQNSSETNGEAKGTEHSSTTKNLAPEVLPTPRRSAIKKPKATNTTGQKKRRMIVSSDDESVITEEVSGIDVLPKSPKLTESHANSGGKRMCLKNMDKEEEQDDLNSNHGSLEDMIQNPNGEGNQRDSQSEVASGEDDKKFDENTNRGAQQLIVTPEKVTLENIMEEITSMNKKLTNIETLLTTGRAETVVKAEDAREKCSSSKPGTSKPGFKNARFLEDGEFTEGNIEIGEVGSKVFVTDMQWAKATSTTTYTAMTVSLLLALFPLETLLQSNYKGGASKFNKGVAEAGPARQALDERIIEAIKYSVRYQYPTQFKEGGFGQAINVKLTALRRQVKK